MFSWLRLGEVLFREFDVMAASFETSHEFTGGSGGIASVEVIVAQVPVGRVGLEHLKSDDRDLMRSDADRPTPIGVSLDPPKEAWQVAFLAVGRRPGSLRPHPLEGLVAFSTF